VQREVTFQSDGALSDVRIRVVPELGVFVIPAVTRLATVQAKTPQLLAIFFVVPKGTQPGTFSGTLHLVADSGRSGSDRTFARPLPITLEIRQPTSAAVPTSLALPSPDRVVTGPAPDNIRFANDELDILFRPSTPQSAILALVSELKGLFLGALPGRNYYQVQFSQEGLSALAAIVVALEQNPTVAFVNYHFVYDTLALPNDPGTALSYSPGLINLPKVWDDITIGRKTFTNSANKQEEIAIAVVDTVFDFENLDLAPNITKHTDNTAPLFSFLDADNQHGTRVASIIAAVGANGLGIAGVMWSGALRLYSAGHGRLAGIDSGFVTQRLLEIADDNKIENATPVVRVRIINLSLAAECETNVCSSDEEQKLIQNDKAFAYQIGLIPNALWAFGAGNNGISVSHSSPARLSTGDNFFQREFENVVSVSAVDSNRMLYRNSFGSGSDYGAGVTVSAPGVNIVSDIPGGGFDDGIVVGALGKASGTSFSVPFASGVAGLMLSVNPDLPPSEVKAILRNTANHTGNRDPELNEVLLLDACRAVKAALRIDDPPRPQLSTPPSTPPIAPASLSACSGPGYQVNFRWSDVAPNSCNDIDHYEFELLPPAGSNVAGFNAVPKGTTLPYNICAPAPLGPWTWRVTARDKFDNRSADAVRSFNLQPIVEPPPMAGTVTFNFTGVVTAALNVGTSISAGSPVTGTFTYDLGAVDQTPDAIFVGTYHYNNPPSGVVININGQRFSTVSSLGVDVTVSDNSLVPVAPPGGGFSVARSDLFTIRGAATQSSWPANVPFYGSGSIEVYLEQLTDASISPTFLVSKQLPTTLNLSLVNNQQSRILTGQVLPQVGVIQFKITTLDRGQ
jgi:thermitase